MNNSNAGWYASVLQKTAGEATGHWKTMSFINSYNMLDKDLKQKALDKYESMLSNPAAAGIHHIMQNPHKSVYAGEIDRRTRSLAVKIGKCYIWYWIGPHEAYNKMVKMMPPMSEIDKVANYILRNKLCNT